MAKAGFAGPVTGAGCDLQGLPLVKDLDLDGVEACPPRAGSEAQGEAVWNVIGQVGQLAFQIKSIAEADMFSAGQRRDLRSRILAHCVESDSDRRPEIEAPDDGLLQG